MIRREGLEGTVLQSRPHRFLRLGVARRRAAAPHRALDARLVHIVGSQRDILRAGLTEDLQSYLLGLPQRLDRLDLRHVDQQKRRIDQPRQRNRPVGRFSLGDAGMGHGMELGCNMALIDQVMRQPVDHVVVLGMYHDQRAVAPRQRQDVEHLVIADLHRVVGHVDLERGVAVLDQRRQLLPQHLRARIGDDQMEGVVDDRLRRRRLVIVFHHLAQRHAAMLGSEGDHRRGAAKRRRYRARIKVIGAHDAETGLLLDVAVAVDAARQDELAAGVDLAGTLAGDCRFKRHDRAILDGDVAVELAVFGNDFGVADDEIVVGHFFTPPRLCGRGLKRQACDPAARSRRSVRHGPWR